MSTSHSGSVKSYVFGFILSLIFTFIPYYLVTEKMLTGSLLLAAILGIAMLQMFIQMFFFLHLGRGPKPLYNIVFFIGTAGAIIVTVVGSIFIMNNLHYNMSPDVVVKKIAQDEGIAQVEGVSTGACRVSGTNHVIKIKNSIAVPASIKANLCDTLTFVNQDPLVRSISFAKPPIMADYSGEEVTLRTNYPITITLNQSGTFVYHDFMEQKMTGSFSVAP